MNIPKHVLNCPWVGQQHDILSFCEHLILILRLSSILSQNDNSENNCSVENVKKDGFFFRKQKTCKSQGGGFFFPF